MVVNYSLGQYSVAGFYEKDTLKHVPPYIGSLGEPAFISTPLQMMVPRFVFYEVKPSYNVVKVAQSLATLNGFTATAISNGTWQSYAMTYLLGITHGSVVVGPVVLSAVLAYSFTAFYVEERRRDISLMSTLGATPSLLSQMYVLQITILGVVSVILGVFGSYLINMLQGAFVSGNGLNQVWTLNALMIGIVIGILIPVVAGFVALNRIPETKVIGGPKKRVIPKEARINDSSAVYTLPLRIGEDEADLFVKYLKENVMPKLKGLNPELTVWTPTGAWKRAALRL